MAETTARDIIFSALQELGIYAPGDTPADDDIQTGLTILNDMIDMWSNESLMCYVVTEQSGTLTPGKQRYSIGTSGGADFNLTRPLRLITGPVSAYIQDTNGNNYPVDVVEIDKWNQLGNRSPTLVTSNFPDTLFYDAQFPLGFLNFFPTPNTGYTAFWDSYLQLSSFASISTSISLPPGYNAAMRHNLAVEMQPFFTDAQLSPIVLTLAMTSKGAIKRTNIKPVEAVYDPELVSRAPGIYNPYTDRRGNTVT